MFLQMDSKSGAIVALPELVAALEGNSISVVVDLLIKTPAVTKEKTLAQGANALALNPETVSPLHFALRLPDVATQIIDALLNAWPESVREKTSGFSELAIHIALASNLKKEILKILKR